MADPISRRRRLLMTTSSSVAGTGATALPVSRSVAVSPLISRTCLSSTVWTSPSRNDCRSGSAAGSALTASARIASTLASPSPSAISRMASGDGAAHSAQAASVATSALADLSTLRGCRLRITTAAPSGCGMQRCFWNAHKKRATAGDHDPLPPSRTQILFLLRLVLLLVVAFDVLAPGLRADRALGLPDDVELSVLLNLADEHGLPQVMVLLVRLDREAVRRREGLAIHGRDHLVDVGRLRLGHRLRPHMDADIRGFHRVVGQRLVGARQLFR